MPRNKDIVIEPDTLQQVADVLDLTQAGHTNNTNEIVQGLKAEQKYLSSKYFYDKKGSELFELITTLPEYYPARTELALLTRYGCEIINNGSFKYLTELGSGSHVKISELLACLPANQLAGLCYLPVDISETAVHDACSKLQSTFPALSVKGIVSDFTQHLALINTDAPKLISFFGSTIGNFTHTEGVAFFKNVARVMNKPDKFIVGFDMVKQAEVIERAYNDSCNITAQFNLNILDVVNTYTHANFKKDNFRHYAFFNSRLNQVEMHLVSNCNATYYMKVSDTEVVLREGESIRTEISRKFTRNEIESMALQAGFQVDNMYTDTKGYFSLALLKLL